MVKKIQYLLVALLFVNSITAQNENKNILFIAVDDLKPLLSNYGHDEMITPNFDRLAKMGVTFTNAHVQQAVCGPSRASIMTGTTPDVTKVKDLHTDFRESNPDLISMPEYLISKGYESTGVGKIYHKGSSSPGHDGKTWSIPHALPTDYDPKYGEPGLRNYQNPEAKATIKALLKEYTESGKKGGAVKYGQKKAKYSTDYADVSDEAYQDGVYAKESIKRMEMLAKQDKPFFLAVGFQRPHLPFAAPKKYWDLYDRKDINLADYRETGDGIPKIAFHNYGELRSYSDIPNKMEFGEQLPEEKQKELIHGYMACISYVDALLGKLLDAVESNGLTDNTVIVLWGDHGYHLGDHSIWCKHSNFEQATRIPLMFAGPGVSKGIINDQPVELLDVFPTLFQLAGVVAPSQVEGVSLVPLLDDNHETILSKDFAISQYTRQTSVIGYSIRTDRYRYTEWHDNYTSLHPYEESNIIEYELYDYDKDPLETVNWIDDSEYGTIKAGLKSKLKTHLISKQITDEVFITKKKSKKKKKNKKKVKKNKTDPSKSVDESNMTKADKKALRKARKKEERKAKKKAERKEKQLSDKNREKTAKDSSVDSYLDQVTSARPAKESLMSIHKKSITNQPNILFIHADDLGYHDLSYTGSDIYDTPNIDQLATQAVSFTNAYSNYPRCTPSRYGMITATYPVNEDHGNLSTISKENNFIALFEDADYQTSFVGKWHLGGGDSAPKGFGFDHSVAAGSAGGTGSHFYPFNTKKHSKKHGKTIEDVSQIGEEGEYLADLLTDQTMAFINNAEDGKPFFAILSHYAVHTPIEAKPEDRERNQIEIDAYNYGDSPEYIKQGEGRHKMRQDDASYAGMVENLDYNVGRLLDMIDEMGIADNTIIVFSSDHGGLSNDGNKRQRHLATTNYPLKAGKGHLYEGGIRVPLLIRWPGHLMPKEDNKSIVLGMDLMPTLLDLAIDKKLEKVDGESFENILEKNECWDDRTVFWQNRKARPYSTGDIPCTAMRSGKWKLMHFFEADYYELYDLSKDNSEKKNLIDKKKKVAEKMKKQMNAWRIEYLVDSKLNRK